MTPLRNRMIEDLQLRGYSNSTQTLYVDAVRQLCEHYDKSPGKITEEELRDYFLYGKNVKKWSRSTSTVALCGIKFFYENTIKRPWPTLLFIRPGREKKLPVVLSRDEVHELLSNIRLLRYRVCLTTIYSCGLRLSEGDLSLKEIEGMVSVQGDPVSEGQFRIELQDLDLREYLELTT
jgi:integrase/recombinase XerD